MIVGDSQPEQIAKAPERIEVFTRLHACFLALGLPTIVGDSGRASSANLFSDTQSYIDVMLAFCQRSVRLVHKLSQLTEATLVELPAFSMAGHVASDKLRDG